MDPYFTGSPLKIGDETQLLIDDTIIEDRWRLTRVMHHPDKFPNNPVLRRDKPWEGDTAQGPNVIWDEEYGKYRMWYLCFNNSAYYYGSGPQDYVGYAESEDGFNWTKPLFDHCPVGKHQKTNIVYMGTYDQGTYYGKWPEGTPITRLQIAAKCQTFKDPNDPDPARRYKMITIEGRPHPKLQEIHCGVNLSCSPDGIHWKIAGDRAILDHSSDCANHVVWDKANQQWLLICRPPVYHSGRSHGLRNIRRRVAMMTSKDFVNWSYPRVILYPDEYDTPDYDHVMVVPYGRTWLMFYGAFEGDTTGRWEMRLASSRDACHWERYHTRETFLGRGPEGSFDGGGVLISGCTPVQQEEHLLFYYSGFTRGQEEQGDFNGAIGLATLKVDRFVEQRAGETPGYLLTKEFILEGKSLRVNVELNKSTNLKVHPRMRVEILRHPPFGQHWQFKEAYEGFSLDDCDPLAIDHTDATVTWKGKSDLSALVGKPVYLRFELQQMGIFAFRIAKE
jgi:hypothetical protein